MKRLILALALVFAALPVLAEQGPTVEGLIDSLARPDGGLSRGFSTRNLAVGQPKVLLDIKFEHDSHAIGPEASLLLDRLGQALVSERLAGDRFLVRGHTNKIGKSGYNQRLSERRAVAVRRFLEEKYPAVLGRLDAQGAGFTRPLTADAADPANRRVEIINVTDQ